MTGSRRPWLLISSLGGGARRVPRPYPAVRRLIVGLFAATCLALTLGTAASAVEPWERLANPALEARAEAIGAELRCLVCQNESIEQSGADLAHDIRMFVRHRLSQGDTDDAVIQAVVNRYGQFVLLRPPVERATWLLWFGPGLLLLIAIGGAAVWLRRARRTAPRPVPLNEEEQSRLAALVREGEG